MNKRVIIVSSDRYPEEDAGAVREHAFALILKELGYEPLVIGMGKPTGFAMKQYDGVDYCSFRYASGNVFFRIMGRKLFKYHLKKVLSSLSVNEVHGIMYISGGGRAVIKYLKDYTRKHRKLLCHDSVEWYSPEQFSNGTRNRIYQYKDEFNTKVLGKGWRVIAISSYLEKHFSKTCDQVVRIPVIMDLDKIDCRLQGDASHEKLIFVYAGAPGKKDYLKDMIKGFSLLSPEQLSKVEVHIVGVNRAQLVEICDVDERSLHVMGDSLIAHGRVPHEEAVAWVRSADFTLLLRDENLRYAKAGFPTKIVESLACGTPPVCNDSSDLSMYLKDAQNAFIIGGHAAEDVKQTIEKILNCDADTLRNMRSQARLTAETHFNYKNYVEQFSELLREE